MAKTDKRLRSLRRTFREMNRIADRQLVAMERDIARAETIYRLTTTVFIAVARDETTSYFIPGKARALRAAREFETHWRERGIPCKWDLVRFDVINPEHRTGGFTLPAVKR